MEPEDLIDYDSEPTHMPPAGVALISDSPEALQNRIQSGYIVQPELNGLGRGISAIRCGSCRPWYNQNNAMCDHPLNLYQCNGLVGCCNRFENENTVAWKK